MGFKIEGGQFYPPLVSANRIGGSINVAASPRGTVTVTRAQPGTVAFTASSYTADEGSLLTFNVNRTGGAAGSIAVDYAITISEGAPLSGATGTLTWNNAEAGAKQVTVQLGLVSATRNGQITLSNARGLGGGSAPAIGGTNPVSLQITNVASAPAADVTTFSVEGTGTQVMSFATTFRQGDVPSGQVPVLTNNSDAVLTGFQSQVRTFHADGSACHAMLHGVVTGGQTYKIRTGIAASGTNKTVADFLAAVPGSIARVLITGGLTGTCDLRDLISSATNRAVMTHNATANLRIIEQGPNVLALRVSQNVGPHLRVTFEVRWYGGSVYWVDAWAVNGYVTLNGMGSLQYTGQLEVNGSLVTQPEAFTALRPHYNHSAWHPGAELAGNAGTGFWSGAPGSLYVRPNTQYIQDSGAVPNYRRTQLPGAAFLNGRPQVCVAMDNCEMRDQLDAGGAGEELALLPRWCAVYIKSGGDVRAFRNMLANDNGGAAYPVFFPSAVHGEQFTENDNPNASYNQGTGFGTGMFTGQSPFGLSAVVSHHPSVGYVSYLVTGNQFYLDLMNAWTAEANIWNSTNRNLTFSGRTIRRYYELSNRAAAWQIRSNGHSAYITPDNHFLKPQFVAWINGVATLYDVPHYGPGGTWRKTIGALYEGDVGAVNYSLFFHMFFAQATAWVALDLGFTSYLPVAQYAGILMAGLFGSTGEYPFEDAPRDRLKLGTTDQTASPETASYYETFALVRSNNNVPPAESGTLAMAAVMDSIDPEHTGLRNECRRIRTVDSYFANILPALSYLHRLGISGGMECWIRSTLCTVQPNFSDLGSQWDIGPREVPLPGWVRAIAPLTWADVPNSIMPAPPNYPGDPGSIINAWGCLAVRWIGSEVRNAAGGGHGDGSGNAVLRIRLNAQAPGWLIERQCTLPATPLNGSHFADGRPNSRHGYYDQQHHQGRDLHIMHGASFVATNAAAFANVDAFNPNTGDYLPANTFPSSTNAGGSGMKAYNLASGCIYYLDAGNNNMQFRRWSIANGTVNITGNLFEFGGIYKAGAVDPIRGILLHAREQGGSSWVQYSIDTGARTNRNPETTPGLTPTQQSLLSQSAGSLEWDIRGRRYLHYVSGQDVMTLNPDPTTGFAASVLSIAGTPPAAATPNGLFSRGRYIPELDIYVALPNPGQPMKFFKFASTQRPL